MHDGGKGPSKLEEWLVEVRWETGPILEPQIVSTAKDEVSLKGYCVYYYNAVVTSNS